MNLASVHPGDLVLIDKKGRRFYAEILAPAHDSPDADIMVAPLDRRVTYRMARAREVVGIWHANKATRTTRPRRE